MTLPEQLEFIDSSKIDPYMKSRFIKHLIIFGFKFQYFLEQLGRCARRSKIEKRDIRLKSRLRRMENVGGGNGLEIILKSVLCRTKAFTGTYVLQEGGNLSKI